MSGSSVVTDVRANSPDNASLSISWAPPSSPNGEILSYFISITDLSDGSTVRQDNTVSTNFREDGLGMYTLLLVLK